MGSLDHCLGPLLLASVITLVVIVQHSTEKPLKECLYNVVRERVSPNSLSNQFTI